MSDIAAELAKLHILKGAEYSQQVERIARMGVFHPVEGESGIYSVGGESSDDYGNLLNAARKAVAHGYKVYILPNPYKIRTPDFIFEKKGTFRPYELKTISGKSSVSHRLEVSYGQSVSIVETPLRYLYLKGRRVFLFRERWRRASRSSVCF